jgi:hypothetical protein
MIIAVSNPKRGHGRQHGPRSPRARRCRDQWWYSTCGGRGMVDPPAHVAPSRRPCPRPQLRRTSTGSSYTPTVTIDEATTITKAAALEIASIAWHGRVTAGNMIAGFKEAGIYPMSLEQMLVRLDMFATGDVPDKYTVTECGSPRRLASDRPSSRCRPPHRVCLRAKPSMLVDVSTPSRSLKAQRCLWLEHFYFWVLFCFLMSSETLFWSQSRRW